MSLSLLATTILCYTTSVNSHRHINRADSAPFGNSTASSIVYERFPNGRITRLRKNRNLDVEEDPGNLTDNAGINDELLSRLNDSFGGSLPITMETNCECKRNMALCFESRFHHLLTQTKLYPTSNSKDYQFCDDNFFDLDPGKPCKCENIREIFADNTEKVAGNRHVDSFFAKDLYSNQLTAAPTLFGMAVM